MVVAALVSVSYATVDELRITEVNPASDLVEVTHIGGTTFTVSANLPFSHKTNTVSFIPAATVFGPGESKVFTVPGIDAALSDLWLFRDTNFTAPASILSGLQWGLAGQDAGGRTAVAVSAGIWPAATDFVSPQSNVALSLRLTSYNFIEPEPWDEGAENLGAYFGTGTPIDNPLPDILFTSVRVDLTPIATGLVSPVTVKQPDDGTDRLFICDQAGKIHIVQGGALLPTPLLDVTSRLVSLNPGFDERGLIGMALHPNFASNPKIYTLTSEPKESIPADFPSPEPATGFNHQGVLAEWTIDASNPNIIDVATRREILRVDEPQSNHNGGTLQFGPDGYLYIALGDGGGRDDENPGHLPDGNGQSLTNPLGKLLRIQIDGGPFPNGRYGIPADNPFVGVSGAVEAIWAYGLRNPFSFSFDRGGTNQLIVGDVGQGEVEEINVVTGGENFGWRLKEGTFFFDANTTGPGFVTAIPVRPLPPEPLVDPIAQYDHDDGISIIGGYVYRGSTFPELEGNYVFGDFGTAFNTPSGRLFYLNDQGEINALTIGSQVQELNRWVKGFGEDESGELYVCCSRNLGPTGNTGVVLKFVGPTAADHWELYE